MSDKPGIHSKDMTEEMLCHLMDFLLRYNNLLDERDLLEFRIKNLKELHKQEVEELTAKIRTMEGGMLDDPNM